MNHSQREEAEGAHDPAAQKRYHRTNEFYHRASEAMGLPWESGKKVAQAIIRNIVRRISPAEASHLINELPLGLKEECVAFNKDALKSINADKICRDIVNASGIPELDPRWTAREFWLFLTAWLNDFPGEQKGESNKVFNQFPSDIRNLFAGETRH